MKKKNEAFHDEFLAEYLNDLDHWLTQWLPLDAETQINSDLNEIFSIKIDSDAEW